jgi:O-antigen/teichoic acid export membrane protein
MAEPGLAPRAEVARATIVLGVAHVVQLAASLANLWLLTRTLGPDGYGELASVLATYVLLGVLTDLGTGVVAIREMAQRPESAPSLLVATLRVRLLLGLLAGGLGALRYGLGALPERAAGLLGAAFPVVQAWGSTRLLLQARLEQGRTARALVLGRLVQLGLVALALRLEPSPLGATGALVLGELVQAALLRLEAGALPRIPWGESLATGASILRAALPLALAFVATQIAGTFDVLLLRALRTPEETGLYGLAERPLSIFEPLPRILLSSVFTILAARAGRGDREGVVRACRETVSALALAAAPIAAGTLLVGPRLLALVFDARYAGAAGPLVVLGVAGSISFLTAPAESALVALGKTRANLAVSLVALAVNVGLNLVLIPRFGPLGAAWAWLATAVVSCLGAHACLFAAGIAPPLTAIARSAVAGAILYLVLAPYATTAHPLAIVGAGVVVYAAASFATGAWRFVDGRPRV